MVALLRLRAGTCTPRLRSVQPALTRRGTVARAEGGDVPVRSLTAEDALKILDLPANASFEEVVQAKNRRLASADGDVDRVVEIEAAYDALFMRSMKKRITGELEVSTSVRYADVPATPKRGAAAKKQGGSGGLSAPKMSAPKLPSAAGFVGFAVPTNQQQVLVQSGVFAAVGLWALAQALLESPEAQLADTAGLQMAVALGYCVYSLRENKRMGLGKAVALTLGCLFAGALVGAGIQQWLRVDIVPIGSFGSPGVFASEVVILFTALGCLFLI